MPLPLEFGCGLLLPERLGCLPLEDLGLLGSRQLHLLQLDLELLTVAQYSDGLLAGRFLLIPHLAGGLLELPLQCRPSLLVLHYLGRELLTFLLGLLLHLDSLGVFRRLLAELLNPPLQIGDLIAHLLGVLALGTRFPRLGLPRQSLTGFHLDKDGLLLSVEGVNLLLQLSERPLEVGLKGPHALPLPVHLGRHSLLLFNLAADTDELGT